MFYSLFGDFFSENGFSFRTLRIGYGEVVPGRSISGEPLKLDGILYENGFGDHADSFHVVTLPSSGQCFRAMAGLHDGNVTDPADVVLAVEDCRGNTLWQSGIVARSSGAISIDCPLHGARAFLLKTRSAKNSVHGANIDWCDLSVTLEDGTELPLNAPVRAADFLPSVRYNGVETPFSAIPDFSAEETAPDSRRLSFTFPDGLVRLNLFCRMYRDYPVAEWQCELENPGDEPSGILESFRSWNMAFPLGTEFARKEIVLRRLIGTQNCLSDFAKDDFILYPRFPFSQMSMESNEGRPSGTWLPFFGIDFDRMNGVMAGIGWTGTWRADFSLASGTFCASAGMSDMKFRLRPGEKVRMPSVLVYERNNQTVPDAQNMFRKFIKEYHSPRNSQGDILKVPAAFMAWGGSDSAHLAELANTVGREKLPYNLFWIDAGWYGPGNTDPKNWSPYVGDWRINPNFHPNGLKTVTDAAHKNGMRAMLWMEIERAVKGTPVQQEHPEYFLKSRSDTGSFLLNLAEKNAREWAFDTIAETLKQNGFDDLRLDFNMDPAPYWRENSEPDRLGILESGYISGLYRLLDDLHREFPDMLIDNCASGGRRIDFEMMSRSLTLWHSDTQCTSSMPHEINQIQAGNLSEWLPFHTNGVWIDPDDPYAFFSGSLCMPVSTDFDNGYAKFRDHYNFSGERLLLKTIRRVAELSEQRYFLLSAQSSRRDGIFAYECLDESGDHGVLVILRPRGASQKILLPLHGIDEGKLYSVEENGNRFDLPGETLACFESMQEERSCRILFFTRQ